MKNKRWRCVVVGVALVMLGAAPAFGQGAPAGSSFEELSKQLTSSPSAAERQAAAVWLGQMGDRRSVAPLIRALERDQDADVRTAAARSLGALRARGAILALQRASRGDPIRTVRQAADAALKQIGDVPALAGDDASGKKKYAPDPERIPAYRSARTRRLAGVLVLTVGGSIGLLVSALGLSGYKDCQDHPYRYASNCGGQVATAIVGGTLLTASVAVGVPLWISGQRRMDAIKKAGAASLVPRINVAASPRLGHVTLRWQF